MEAVNGDAADGAFTMARRERTPLVREASICACVRLQFIFTRLNFRTGVCKRQEWDWGWILDKVLRVSVLGGEKIVENNCHCETANREGRMGILVNFL
jgi:hypothetical protein